MLSSLKRANPLTRKWQPGIAMFLVAVLGMVMVSSPVSLAQNKQPKGIKVKLIRIGYQKSGSLLIMKAKETLEKRLVVLGVKVKWNEFSAGIPLLEALNAGSIDVGHSGDAPAVVAQASGAPFVYIANSRPSPKSVALLVPKNSPIKSVSGLRGKKIAVGKGSSAHFFLVKALEKAGVQFKDIQPVYLNPPDARLAFTSGQVDAWAIWDPFFAAAQQDGARILVNGEGVTPFREFYLANRSFVEQNPQLTNLVIQEIQASGNWAITHQAEVAKFVAQETKLNLSVVELAESRRRRYGAYTIQPSVIQEQQQVADLFYQLNLIPKTVRVASVVWQPNLPASK